MVWILQHARRRAIDAFSTEMAPTLAWLDLIVSLLIAISVLLLGQAVVSYEVFTGRTLPRRGFARSWRNAVVLAVGYSALVSWSLVNQLRAIYGLLLTAILMVSFYALLSWRSFAEREKAMAQLRPFAASQRLVDALVSPTRPDLEPQRLFRVLCDEVLGTDQAYLVPLGPLADLVDRPLVYPDGPGLARQSVREATAQLESAHSAYVPLDPARTGGARWAVPLWSERGLLGVLLLGAKREGGLYSEEEMEVARASGERLLDTLAAVETARRLVALLRQRIAHVQVMEGQGRRVLHDHVLPQLHAALLYLAGRRGDAAIGQAVEALTGAHRQISDLMRDAAGAVPERLAEQGLVAALRALIDRDYEGAFAEVTWQIVARAEAAALQLPPWVSQVVYVAAQELVRNAARHGRGDVTNRPLRLRIALEDQEGLWLRVLDDGVGLASSLRLARRDAPGSGQGLRFHSTMLTALGGRLEVTDRPEGGAQGLIAIPRGVMHEPASYPS